MLLREAPDRDELPTTHLIDDDEGPAASDQEVWDALTRTFQSPSYRPPVLPAVAVELMAMASHADVDVPQVVRLLEKDAMLAGRVLKLCNSPAYAGAQPIRSLRSAVVRLGIAELRDLVMEASLHARVFKASGYKEAVDTVRMHSTAVAYIARAISRFTTFDAEYAFLCGLLHDVGYSAALTALGDIPRGQTLRPVAELWSGLGALHEHVGAAVASAWKLPVEVQLVIRHHHALKVSGVVHPVAAIILLAEHFAPKTVGPNDAPSLQQLQSANAALGFDAERFKLVERAAKAALGAMPV